MSESIEQAVSAEQPTWGVARRFGFRLVLVYFILRILPFPIAWIPWTDKLNELYLKLLAALVVWAGPAILGIDRTIATESNGSGDRTYNYVLTFCLFALSLIAATVWSAIDRRPRRHDGLLRGLQIYVRTYLGVMMLGYGFAKIFERQFLTPSPGQLVQTYGESSPMHLLWTFMGFSRPYTMFAGFMEAIPGVLLFVRRTATTGALLLLAVLTNVVLLNLCYDVPVKLLSIHLWLMALFLAAPAIPKLVAILVGTRPVGPAFDPPFFTRRKPRIIAASLYAVLVATMAYDTINTIWTDGRENAHAPSVRDLFDVEEMTIDGVPQLPVPANASRWRRVWIRAKAIRVYWMDGRSEIYVASDEIKGPATLVLRLATDNKGVQRARLDLRQDGAGYVLSGDFEGKKVHAHLTMLPREKSLLMTRGFRWINDVPFNR
jgi:hypothetical protein